MELTTERVPERDRLAYWSQAVSRVLAPATVTARDTRSFSGRLASDHMGFLQITTLAADAQRICWDARQLAADKRGLLTVAMQKSGAARLRQAGRVAELAPGQLVLVDTGRPHVLDHAERAELALFTVPAKVVGLRCGEVDQALARVISPDEGMGRLLAPFLESLSVSARTARPDVAHRLAGNTADLVATLVAEQAGAGYADPDAARTALLTRIRQFVDQRLEDPDLDPTAVAAANNISVRYLHRLFENEGTTVRRWIQRRRLEECARELTRRSGSAPSVSAVARRWGFTNASHFSRVFRAAYGMSPRQWRTGREGTRPEADLGR